MRVRWRVTSEQVRHVPAADPRQRKREQRSWYFYDWAAQPMFTSVTTAFGAAFIGGLAEESAKQDVARNGARACVPNELTNCDIDFFGFTMAAGVVWNYLIPLAIVAQVLVLPITGAINDRSFNRKRMLAILAFIGATAIALMVFATGTNWQLAAGLYLLGRVAEGASIIVYYSFLADVADPDERDRVSSHGWAMGYLGGGLALALQLVPVMFHETFGLTQGEAVRVAFLMSGLWWAGFTLIPLTMLRQRNTPSDGLLRDHSVLTAGFIELGQTVRGAIAYPLTLWFLGAYLVYNDGVATVINVSAQYGKQELGFGQDTLIVTILVVQYIAFVGAWVLGKLAGSIGAKRTVMSGLVGWIGIVTAAYFLEPGNALTFWLVAAAIGFVLGGTQALSRSLFSQLIPAGKEGQYFSLYEMSERGTSWMGPLLFGIIAEATGSFRPAIVALSVFFVAGLLILAAFPVRRAVLAAGNTPPDVV